MKTLRIAALAVVGGAIASANATWYFSEAAFVAAIAPGYYLETFAGWTYGSPLNGSQLTWSAPGANGYGWDASAPGGLWSNPDALSTNSAFDPVTITMTGNTATAFGARLANSDINGALINGTVTLDIAGIGLQSMATGGGEQFIGWVGGGAITSATMSADDPGVNSWVNIDNVYTGVVPEPATMLALGLGSAVVALRRRVRK
ncbi:MAG: PEP-CTERM sorting domain-containing protein [Armatimonadetes bacterium]|uniref:Ice-binding protein C-terminal domain-containing protein n=1 Tax=Candidatus Nitrosymbiomonas proteolyticus TaxID=2608984 RepID=A0A809SEL8_9BACT|nr:MAG: hypothetical protein UZ18_ATM001001045 [Armatimonadetes bacterium OLB18]MCK6632739.1 PEP-CTERM sorting domain-containing protein [Fimbriimonadaceae bacterium]NOG38055.1 PEP-CTERM sorting domain-containing protein [Armatimonadota bacterium]BBO24034.1 conserved hypothetical protein [Candidatus Nitrosymbiomonas proteolyticus]MCZ7581225.1 PEP-CTERM sorting domain-containing protein [Fimbriimonadaceae bacterium]